MSNANQISCDEALKRLFEYLDHELDAEHQGEVEQHLHDCRACYSRAEFEKRLKGKLSALGQDKAPETVGQRVRKLLERY